MAEPYPPLCSEYTTSAPFSSVCFWWLEYTCLKLGAVRVPSVSTFSLNSIIKKPPGASVVLPASEATMT